MGIEASEYEDRRRKLMKLLEPGAVVVVPSARVKYMAHHILCVRSNGSGRTHADACAPKL